MKSLLLLTPTLEPKTGWGRYAHALRSRFETYFDIRVIDTLPHPTEILSLPVIGASTDYLNPIQFMTAVRTVRGELSEFDAVLSLVAFPYSLVARAATYGTGTPYFVSCHGTYAVKPLHSPTVGTLAKHSFTNASELFPVSSFTANRIRQQIAGLNNITVVQNGIDETEFEDASSYEINHDVLLSVGAIKPRKGQHISVKSLSHVADEFPSLHIHFVGKVSDEEYLRRVRQIAQTKGIADRVHIEGRVSQEELAQWYASADVFMLPSQYLDHEFEGYGLVYLEANTYGVPVIGPDDCGAVDAIADGTSGFCVRNDATAFADAIRMTLEDESRYRELSEGASHWAQKQTWDDTAERISERIHQHTGPA